jgi:hypothetical protein
MLSRAKFSQLYPKHQTYTEMSYNVCLFLVQLKHWTDVHCVDLERYGYPHYVICGNPNVVSSIIVRL